MQAREGLVGSVLGSDQVGRYLDIAREHELDGVLTISSQITHSPEESPVDIDGRKLRKAWLWHLSWWRIMTVAVVQSRYRGISDPDQAWVLRELIHYLGSEGSGAVGFEDMGKHWVGVRNAAHDGTLRHGDEQLREVAERWEQFTEYLCLSLAQELGREVRTVRPRKQTSSLRIEEVADSLAGDGVLESTIRVPDAVGDIGLRADLRSRQTEVSVEVAAPTEGRVKSRINWLLRQLSDAWPDLRVEVWYPHARESVVATLAQASEDPRVLSFPADPKREPRAFVLTLTRPLGQKRGRSEGSFVRETRSQAVAFYRDLVQTIKPWQPRAPQLRKTPRSAEDAEPSVPDLLPMTSADEISGEEADAAGRPDRPGGQ